MYDYRDPRVRELERLKFALDAAARQFDEFEARVTGRTISSRTDQPPAESRELENGYANQIMFAMDRFRAADKSAR